VGNQEVSDGLCWGTVYELFEGLIYFQIYFLLYQNAVGLLIAKIFSLACFSDLNAKYFIFVQNLKLYRQSLGPIVLQAET